MSYVTVTRSVAGPARGSSTRPRRPSPSAGARCRCAGPPGSPGRGSRKGSLARPPRVGEHLQRLVAVGGDHGVVDRSGVPPSGVTSTPSRTDGRRPRESRGGSGPGTGRREGRRTPRPPTTTATAAGRSHPETGGGRRSGRRTARACRGPDPRGGPDRSAHRHDEVFDEQARVPPGEEIPEGGAVVPGPEKPGRLPTETADVGQHPPEGRAEQVLPLNEQGVDARGAILHPRPLAAGAEAHRGRLRGDGEPGEEAGELRVVLLVVDDEPVSTAHVLPPAGTSTVRV